VGGAKGGGVVEGSGEGPFVGIGEGPSVGILVGVAAPPFFPLGRQSLVLAPLEPPVSERLLQHEDEELHLTAEHLSVDWSSKP